MGFPKELVFENAPPSIICAICHSVVLKAVHSKTGVCCWECVGGPSAKHPALPALDDMVGLLQVSCTLCKWSGISRNHHCIDTTIPITPTRIYKDDIIGHVLDVYWTDDDAWYRGVVIDWNGSRHRICYDDGELEWVNLQNERIRLVYSIL